MGQAPSNAELERRLPMGLLAQYQSANSYDAKMGAFECTIEMANADYVGACYVVGSCMVGEGPCGDGFFERDNDKAVRFLNRARQLGDPIAESILARLNG